MPVVVTGKTWNLRDRLKSLGGRWNNDSKGWEFYTLSAEHRRELTAHVGVMISEKSGEIVPVYQPPRRGTPLPKIDFEKLIEDALDKQENRPFKPNTRKSTLFGNDHSWFNHFYDQNPTGFFGFSSLPAMIKYVEGLSLRDQNGAGWTKRDLEWSGSECMSDAIDIARDGWSDGVALAQELHEKLIGQHAKEKRRKHSVAGGSVNVGRLLAGSPDHMISRPKQPGSKIVTFFVEGFMSSGIDSDNAIIRAALVGAIADILEINGYSCEIVSITTARTDGGNSPAFQIATTLKQAGESLDLNDIVFGLGHPSYFRRLGFGCVGSSHELRNVWSYMGAPAKAFNTDHRPLRNEIFVDKITIGKQHHIDDDAPLITKAMQIWDLITDGNLPVTLNREDAA